MSENFFFFFLRNTFSYLTSLSCPGHVNLSSPTFGNINLTETIYLLLGNSVKYGCNIIFFHPKLFKITSKPNSYLTSVTRRGLVIPPTVTFPNIDVTQAMAYGYSKKKFIPRF